MYIDTEILQRYYRDTTEMCREARCEPQGEAGSYIDVQSC